ncbi:MAG TPA: metal ABC transporter substrate-binding protein, partial [Acidimicrobiales bacterium]
VIFVNGLRLEDPTLELARKHKRDGARLVMLGDEVLSEDEYIYDFSFPRSGGKPNPHLWTDPTFARRYVDVIHDTVQDVETDVDARVAYTGNRDRLQAKLHDFDVALREATDTIRRPQRKLLTYHDAYAYFARTYDWTVIGAIQVESFDDPTPKELAALIEQVREEDVPAIFGSEVFASPVLEQIGREAGVRYVDELRDDDLPGEPGDPEHSWLGLMRFDYVTMVRALGGDPSALEALDVADVAPDQARYPQ